MSQWNSGPDDIAMAEYAPSPFGTERAAKKSGIGCIVGIVLGVLAFFMLILIAAGSMYYLLQNRAAKVDPFSNNFDAKQYVASVEDRVREDLAKGKLASLSTESASEHPRYEEFEKLIAAAEEAFDETSNPKTNRLIDADRHEELKLHALRKKGYGKYELAGFRVALPQDVTGPTPFRNAEITRIESINKNDFQLFMMLDTGYGPEPVVWWVTTRTGRLLIYDWCQLELGIRSTDESAEMIDATMKDRIDGYSKYSDLCYKYLDVADEHELDYVERRAKVSKIFKQMERLSLPNKLAPSVKLIIAKRWAIEVGHEESLRLFNSARDRSQTPGWYKLAGNAYFERNDFSNAAQQFEKYREVLGDEREVLQRLATCYQRSGDVKAERDIRLGSVRLLTRYSSGDLLRLLSLLDESEMAEVLDDVRARQGDELLTSVLSTAKANPYYWKELRQIKDYLVVADPESRVAIISQLYEALTQDDPQIDPQWMLKALNQDGDQDGTLSSYDLWYEIAEKDPDDILRGLQETGCSKENLNVIKRIYDYEGLIEDKQMLSIAEMGAKKHPQWYLPHLITGNLKRGQDQPEAALESGNKALQLFETSRKDSTGDAKDGGDQESEGDEGEYSNNQEASISNLRLWALYESGEQKQAHELAIAKDMVPSLIRLKNEAKDFDGLEELLSELDPEDPLIVLQRARKSYENGNPEQAIEQLAKHVNELDSDRNDSYGRSTVEYQLAEWCRESDDPLKLFKLCPSAARFNDAFRGLLDRERWEKCEQALQRASKDLSEDELLSSQIRLAWGRRDYQKVCGLAERRESLGNGYANQDCYQQMVRSAIRSDKQELALSIALEAKDKFSNDTITMIAAIAADKIDIARPLLRASNQYATANLINDEDAGSKLIQAVQQKRLVIGSVSMKYGTDRKHSSTALLAKSRLIANPMQIKTALKNSGVKAIGDVEELENQRSGVKAWRSTGDDRELWFIQSQLAPADEPNLTDEQKKAGVAQAKSMLSVVVFDPKLEDEQQARLDSKSLARTITTQLISDQCLAFQSRHQWVSIDQLRDDSGKIKPDAQIADVLDRKNWWYYPPKSSNALEEQHRQRFREALGNAARTFEKGQDSLRVSAPIEVAGARQLVTMQVESIELSYSDAQFVGVVEPGSPLDSRFVDQLKYSISFGSVIEFSYSKSGAGGNGSTQTFKKTWAQVTE